MIPTELVHVSKQSILTKHFGIDMKAFEKLSEKEKEEAKKVIPTSEEEKFMEIFKSDIPQLARLQRKMSVCLDVEVIAYDFDFIFLESNRERTHTEFVKHLKKITWKDYKNFVSKDVF